MTAKPDHGLRSALCTGCGLCACIHPEVEMSRCTDGFLRPSRIPCGSGRYCPARRLSAPSSHELWGRTQKCLQAWSSDPQLRWKASSGGSVTALCLYLLESGKVSGVLQVGGRFEDNGLRLSRTREEVMSCCGSRYAPAPVFENLKELMDGCEGPLAFVGKPCDVSALQNYLRLHPGCSGRIAVTIAIFCAGIPSYNATQRAASACSAREDAPSSVTYRGEGWPGSFRAVYEDGGCFEMDYESSWGNILGRDLPLRCKICPDGVGLCADIAAADAWNIVEGRPSFKEADGRNALLCRTDSGVRLVSEASAAGYLCTEPMDMAQLSLMQPYQKLRRERARSRMLPMRLLAPWAMHFKGCFCRSQLGFRTAFAEFKGSAKRCLKVLFG